MNFDDYLFQEELHHGEGNRGVKNIQEVCSRLGYRDTGFLYGTSLEVFLADNPGCIEAITNWIGEHLNEEQKENLISEARKGYEDEDAEDESGVKHGDVCPECGLGTLVDVEGDGDLVCSRGDCDYRADKTERTDLPKTGN